jgi:hypothetical protein
LELNISAAIKNGIWPNNLNIMKKKVRMSYRKAAFFVTGISTLLWFLIRVIPKPSRAAYPCMRAAAPIASSLAGEFIL